MMMLSLGVGGQPMSLDGILLLGILVGAAITPGEIVMQLASTPDQAESPPLQVASSDFKQANEVRTPADNTGPEDKTSAAKKHDHGANNSSGHPVTSTEHRDPVDDDGESNTAGEVDICDDGNFCTDDFRNQANECVHVNNSRPCDDLTVCTTNDRCSNGACMGTSISCDDSNICTHDVCHPTNGCVHVNNNSLCNDGFFCNGQDTCNGGSCSRHSGNPCPEGVPCNELTQDCGSGTPRSMLVIQAVKRNNVPLTPGTCNLAQATPTCSTGKVGTNCASNAECHVGSSFLIPNTCAGGANIGRVCSTNADCPGSTCISVLPDDQFETEIFLSRWGTELPAGVRLYQAKINTAGYISPDNGTVIPLGWCAPVTTIPCISSETCPSEFPICSPSMRCMCSPHNPDLGAFITTSRKDFLFNGVDGLRFVDTTSIGYVYVGLATDETVSDLGYPRYLGSLILKVSANACGTFVVDFVNEESSTFIGDSANPPNQAYPISQSLILTVSTCPRQLLTCTPTHCNVDARIAHDRFDAGIRFNTDSVLMTFSKPTTDPLMVPANFEITVEPKVPGEVPPEIISVTPFSQDPKKTTVQLSRPIQQTRWTCIRNKESNKRCCLGSLPPDADFNRISNFNDVFELYDNLFGVVVPALAIEKCDTDRSLLCTAADLLLAVDLLNGADAFTEVSGDVLPLCPETRPPQ